MENNLENKAKFFAQYWGQKTLSISDLPLHTLLSKTIDLGIFNNGYLQLNPLFSITDEDAIEVARMFYNFSNVDESIICLGKEVINDIIENNSLGSNRGFNKYLMVADYLRSKGYALPYMGLSVEKMIEYGWIKLQ